MNFFTIVFYTREDFGPFLRVRGDFFRVSAPWNYFEQVFCVAGSWREEIKVKTN